MAGLDGNDCIEVFKEYYLWSNKKLKRYVVRILVLWETLWARHRHGCNKKHRVKQGAKTLGFSINTLWFWTSYFTFSDFRNVFVRKVRHQATVPSPTFSRRKAISSVTNIFPFLPHFLFSPSRLTLLYIITRVNFTWLKWIILCLGVASSDTRYTQFNYKHVKLWKCLANPGHSLPIQKYSQYFSVFPMNIKQHYGLELSTLIPQTIKNGSAFRPSNPTSGKSSK